MLVKLKIKRLSQIFFEARVTVAGRYNWTESLTRRRWS